MILKKIFASFIHGEKPAQKAQNPIKEEEKPKEEKSKEMMDYLSSAGNINRAAVIVKEEEAPLEEPKDGYVDELTPEEEGLGVIRHVVKYEKGEKVEEIIEEQDGTINKTEYADGGLHTIQRVLYDGVEEFQTETYLSEPEKPVFIKNTMSGSSTESVLSYYPTGEKLCEINGKLFTIYNKSGEAIEGFNPKYTILSSPDDADFSSEVEFFDNKTVKKYSIDYKDAKLTYSFSKDGKLTEIKEENSNGKSITRSFENLYD